MAELTWHRVAGVEELPEGRVRTVVAGHKSVALTRARCPSRLRLRGLAECRSC